MSFTKDEQRKLETLAPQVLPWKLNVVHADFSHVELLTVQTALNNSLETQMSLRLKYVEYAGIDERRNRVVIHLLDLSPEAVATVTRAAGPQPPSVCVDPLQGTPAVPA